MAVVSRAPTRIDLAGGTLDIWPLYLLHPGAVTVNVAVSVHAVAEAVSRPAGFAIRSEDRDLAVAAEASADLARREPRLALAAGLVDALSSAHPVTLRLRAAAPAHAGLGGSSALAIAAAAALDRHAGGNADPDRVLRFAMDVETAVIAVPTGQQDYLAALGGGLQALHWETGGLRRERLEPGDLERRLVLCYTGAPRFSGANNWEVTRRRIDGDREVTHRLDAIRDAARSLVVALRAGDGKGIAAAIDAEWRERRSLTPGITTPEIDLLEARSREAGATAFKVCGAGGGGCVVAIAEPGRREAVASALASAGGHLLDCTIDQQGLVVRDLADGREPAEESPT